MRAERLREPAQRVCGRLRGRCKIAADRPDAFERTVARLADRRSIGN